MDLSTPADVNRKIIALGAVSDALLRELEPLCEREARLQVSVEKAGIARFLASEGTVEHRKALARQAEYEAGREEWIVLRARTRFLWKRLARLDADMELLRSIGRNLRAELGALGSAPG